LKTLTKTFEEKGRTEEVRVDKNEDKREGGTKGTRTYPLAQPPSRLASLVAQSLPIITITFATRFARRRSSSLGSELRSYSTTSTAAKKA
jgi:hypothetical protein